VFKKLLFVVLPLAILAGGWYFLQSQKAADSPAPSLSLDSGNSTPAAINSELASNPASQTTPTPQDNNSDVATAIVTDISESNSTRDVFVPEQRSDQQEKIDVTTIAIDDRLTDEEFERLEALIRRDKGLRMQLLEEFRYNTDSARAKQLAALLGPYNDPEILQTASELVYSGDPESMKAGLDLLSRIQPRSSEARDIAIDLLSSENNPDLLVSTMNVLATPARTADPSQRQLLADNLNNLSNHYDPIVRSHSLSLVGRWDKNSPSSRESLTRGLNDTDPTVRSSAAFAIRNIQNPDDNMIDGLLNIAEDTTIKKSTRYAALEALAQMNLSSTTLRRYNLTKSNINRRVQ